LKYCFFFVAGDAKSACGCEDRTRPLWHGQGIASLALCQDVVLPFYSINVKKNLSVRVCNTEFICLFRICFYVPYIRQQVNCNFVCSM